MIFCDAAVHSPGHGRSPVEIINECDAKLERYRAALDAGADPAVVTGWLAQTQTDRARAEADLDANAGSRPRRMSRAEIRRPSAISPLPFATPTPRTKPRSTANSAFGSPTSRKRKRCALQWI
jgi:hypothetical protein